MQDSTKNDPSDRSKVHGYLGWGIFFEVLVESVVRLLGVALTQYLIMVFLVCNLRFRKCSFSPSHRDYLYCEDLLFSVIY